MKIEELEKPLDRKHVKQRKQAGFSLSYIEGWWAIAEANRIFGFDGWTRETVYCKKVCEYEYNDKFKVGYEAMVRVTVGDVTREGTGHGSGIAKDLFDCIEGAAKEAETDAMKRALMTFGNPFGLALYDKGQTNVETVVEKISVDQATVIHDLIAETNSDLQGFLGWLKVERIQDIPKDHYNAAVSALERKKESK